MKHTLSFIHIPLLARFILNGHLENFVVIQIRISRELDVPILKYFSHMSESELIAYSMQTSGKFLTNIADNKSYEQLQESLNDWRRNQLQGVQQQQIALDDLFLITRVRKKAFMEMIKLFTNDMELVYDIIDELDRFFLAYDTAAATTYIELLQERIAESSYFKEKLTETSPGFYYTYDIKNDRQVQKTEKLYRYLGYEPSDYSEDDKFFRKLIHPEDLENADKYVQELKEASGEEVHYFEYRLKESSGKYKWMRNYESIYKRDEDGKAEHILGVAFDITKERFISEELKKRETDLLEAQELANIGSYLWDLKGTDGYRTKQTEKILGLKESDKFDELMKKIHPSDRKRVQEAIDIALHKNGIFENEYRINDNGKEKIIWGRGKVTFENGEPVQMKGTIMDVTDRHYMTMKLRRSEELYKQAQELNKLGNWTWEIKTDKLHWSDELFRIYGLEPQSEEVNFERFTSFIHPDDKEERLRQLEEQLKNTNLKEYYFRIIANDGIEKILYGQSQVLADEMGIPYKIIGTCQDVTRQKELENSLYKKTQLLERSNESLEEFAYISSHDLKEPLRKISVFIGKLKSANENNLDKESHSIINKIVSSTARMQRMVDEILSLSRITSDQSFKKTNLNQLLDEVKTSLDAELYEQGASIIYQDLPYAYINDTQFRQLFTNLITNSIKFRRPGISPLMEITHNCFTGKDIVDMHLERDKKYLQIKYRDNGIGFGDESSNKIFTIFHRLHSRDKYEGTGIGLAICKKIVEHHHGIITARGDINKGAEFIITIPV